MKKIELGASLSDYFHTELRDTARKQGKVLSEATTHYLSNLLCKYTHTSNYFVQKNIENGKQETPTLALMWLEGLQENTHKQYQKMQQLGDFALFTSGFFGDKIKGSLLDMDYYIAMGGKAYKRAGEIQESISAERALNVFFELAQGFPSHMELLDELAIRSQLIDEKALLRLYEKWLVDRSDRIARILNEQGIIPSKPDDDIT